MSTPTGNLARASIPVAGSFSYTNIATGSFIYTLTATVTYDYTPAPVPGPLPLLGPMGALAASRRLRARCRAGKAILRG